MSAAVITPAMRPYRPYGAALELLYYRGDEVVLSGPAGTGKSIGCLNKMHICAEKYAGMRGLMVRRTRESLTESGLVTFEEKVVPEGHPILRGAQRRMRQAYHYPNGSELVVGGMDKAQKVMSTEYDIIYAMEAIELEESDWESLTTRLRNGRMPYQQLLADTNPDRDTHWLNQRRHRSATKMLESRHQDNPALWDHVTQQWTPAGVIYIARLDRLTGMRKARLRDGIWASAEGLVYEDFNPHVHVRPVAIPRSWSRYWVVDFGFTNPFVWQAWAVDPDGRAYLYRELYRTQMLVEDHARAILKATEGEPRPVAIICDHDAEDRATLERYLKLRTIGAYKAVSPGMQAVQQRLRIAGDGRPRLFILPGALVNADAQLIEDKQPYSTEQEFSSYAWAKAADGRANKEEPVKRYDHGMDATRYLVAHLDQIGKERGRKMSGASAGARPTVAAYQPR